MTIIIYLIARSGSGKYTIAKELEREGFKVVDNQLINNPIFSLLDLGDGVRIPKSAWETIAQIRIHVFEFMSQEQKHNYVMTNELLDDEGDHRLFRQVQEMAEKRGSTFIPVLLHISKEENARRIQAPERALRFKSTKIYELDYQKPMIIINHPNLMGFDVDQLSAKAVAQKIMVRIEEIITS